MEPLISVIVPIFNVEEYLDRCVESIVNQTYKNLEIILVDDGSPDNCPQMCDNWAKKDSRIKVVHKENGGLSDARNAGFEVATGEYISFIDSDDWISLEFYDLLLETMDKEKSDIVECVAKRVYREPVVEQDRTYKTESCSKEDGLRKLINENPFKQHVWNKLYKRSVINSILFPIGKINEDEFWTYKVFGNADKISYIHKEMYYYFQRSDSIMGNAYSLKRLDVLEAMTERQVYIEERFPSLEGYSRRSFMGTCVYAGQCSLRLLKKEDVGIAKSKLKNAVKKCRLKRGDYRFLNLKYKIWFFLANHSFFLCCKIRNFLKIGL